MTILSTHLFRVIRRRREAARRMWDLISVQQGTRKREIPIAHHERGHALRARDGASDTRGRVSPKLAREHSAFGFVNPPCKLRKRTRA